MRVSSGAAATAPANPSSRDLRVETTRRTPTQLMTGSRRASCWRPRGPEGRCSHPVAGAAVGGARKAPLAQGPTARTRDLARTKETDPGPAKSVDAAAPRPMTTTAKMTTSPRRVRASPPTKGTDLPVRSLLLLSPPPPAQRGSPDPTAGPHGRPRVTSGAAWRALARTSVRKPRRMTLWGAKSEPQRRPAPTSAL